MSLFSVSVPGQQTGVQEPASGSSSEREQRLESHLPFHAQSIGACLGLLKTTLQGLNEAEAQTRLQEARKTGIQPRALTGKGQLFLGGMKKTVSLLFLAASGVSFFNGNPVDGILILVAMLANGGIQGLIQWKSLQGQQSGLEISDLRCTVRRDGQSMTLNAHDLVVGDMLLISAGQTLPGDARLVSCTQVQVDESPLTGESVLVPKNANDILHPAEDVTAQSNMLFAGTLVKTGKGEALITALGTQTVMGKIASLARNTEKRQSPFTQRLNALSHKIFWAVLILGALIIGVGIYRHMPVAQLVQIGLMMGIAAFPETLPGLASLVLSVSVGRLNEKKVMVKNFQALETVGDLNVICTDKTGTLTENYLVLDQLFLPGLGAIPYDPQWQSGEGMPCKSVEEFLRVGRLNNGTMAEGLRSALMGDPIDVALYRAAPAKLEEGYHQRLSIPFDPVTLRSATLCENAAGQTIAMIKGAPESVIEHCRFYLKPDGSLGELTLTQRSEFLMLNRKLAYENNLRVVGFAQKPMLENDDSGPYSNAIFVGWVCLKDPAKAGVRETVHSLRQTGARLIMITGDQRATAEMTARELGLICRNSDEVWLRSDLEANDLPQIPESVKVFARTKPEEKLAIVESLQQGRQVVAMVGDGVNDSPALQKSDVAIAMGLQGSQAAQDSADIILMNDRLEGVLHAIMESRVAKRKIQSCMRYLLSCNLGLILFIGLSVIAGFGMPVNIVQMLWLNLIIVSIPAIVLAIEPTTLEVTALPQAEAEDESEEWHYHKRDANASSPSSLSSDPLDQSYLFLMLFWGSMIALTGLGVYAVCAPVLKLSPAVSSTAAFCALALSQTFNLFNVQALNAGENRRAFLAELATTPITWLVLAVCVVIQLAGVYIPVLGRMIGTTPLPPMALGVALVLSVIGVIFSLKTLRV